MSTTKEVLEEAVTELEAIATWLDGHNQYARLLAVKDKISAAIAVEFHQPGSDGSAAQMPETPQPITPTLTEGQQA